MAKKSITLYIINFYKKVAQPITPKPSTMKKKSPNYKTLFWINKSIVVIILLLCTIFSTAQTVKKVRWMEMSNNRNATFYDVQKDFNNKWKGPLKEMAREKRKAGKEKKEEIEVGGFEAYKRWESYMAPRVYPSGNMVLPSTNYQNFMAWKKASLNPQANNTPTNILSTGNWTSLGPVGSPTGPSPYSRTGAGRVNFVRFNPSNSNIMYVGTPDGGLWQSTDGGTTWSTNTDFLSVIGCSDLAIDPTNPNNMYLATGDLERNRFSIGVLKSTDGGATWNTTGLTIPTVDGYVISRLIMNPSNPLNMLVSTNGGIFRTTDGWATCTQSLCCSNIFKDMEFKPGDPNTVYVAGSTFWKSTDNGADWTQITTGLPSTNVQRIALGVSAANSGYVYALIGKASDQSFLGMYRSTDSGTSFSFCSSSPNLLGYEADGSDTNAGQAGYDLSIAVSPTNAELVTTGGINHWQSADGGVTWTNKSLWYAGQIHADIHDLYYLPGSSTTIFSCNDGGIFKSTDNATNWTDISHNLSIAQVVGIGLSANVATTVVDGEQDNGTNLKTGAGWNNIFGGDGGACFIDYANNNTIYAQYVEGDFLRSDDGGASFNPITSGLPTGFNFYSAWHQDPVTSTKLYVGGSSTLYVSANKGNNWSALGTPPGTGTISEFAVSPSNSAIIYAVKRDAISKSTNSGVSFTNITGTLPSTGAFSNVAVSNTDPNKVWVTYSGYSAPDKVYKSVDGGVTWSNISAGLPNLPVNTIVFTNGSANDAIYIGADIGVYYFDNTLSSWTPFMTNLPNNAVTDLKIYYPTGKIRAATYGRGSWESNVYPGSNDNLSNLTISSGTLNPSFDPGTTIYTASVSNSTSFITITPTAADPTSTIVLGGATIPSGTPTPQLPLQVGVINNINFVVTAQDGTNKTYTVNVTRAASSNDNLSNLTISSGTLNPSFDPGTTIYTASVSNSTSFITVTPTAADASSTIVIGGATIPSGTPSPQLPLQVGVINNINLTVTAQDGTAKNYTVNVTRAASSNDNLTNLTISSGTLNPSFDPGTTIYTASVSNSTSFITVTPTAADASSNIVIGGATIPSGIPSPQLPLQVGVINNINLTVTAQDGTAKNYTVNVTRAASSNDNLSNLTISSGALNPLFDPGTSIYTASVSNSTSFITVTPTAADASSTIVIGGATIPSGTPSPQLPLQVGVINNINLTVTAQDGTTKNYTINITRAASADASLANLSLSGGGTLIPVFTPTTTSYLDSVANKFPTITVTPVSTDPNATIKVDGTTVASGSASGPIALSVGYNTITITVTAQDGTTTQTYTVTMVRVASANDNLASINPSVTPLSPVFAPATNSYTLSVPNATASMTVTPVTSDANATLKVNGTALTSGTVSSPIALAEGTTTPINIVVTAPDGITTKTYTITVTRAPSVDASLANMSLSGGGTLTPAFSSATISYLDSVANKIPTITVTPVSTDPKATIKVNGTAVTSGSASGPIALVIGQNTITVTVTAQNGITTKTYTVAMVRVPSANANLASINPSIAPLTPAFAPGINNYTLSVSNAVSTMTVSPITSDAGATMKVNGTTLGSGATSTPIPLAAGTTTPINIVVTAPDGITTKTYNITVTRAPSVDATLAKLSLSNGTLSPTFISTIVNYTSSVPNSIATIKVTPTTTDAHATIKVNGTAVASGSASQSITLATGVNTIYVVVTAQNGTTNKTYNIQVTRVASANDNLASINPSVSPLSPAFAPATTSYSLSVPNATASMTVQPITSDPHATMKVNGTALASGTVSSPIALAEGAATTINIVVTAPDGITTKTYVISIVRASSGDATLSNINLSGGGTLIPVFAPATTSYLDSVANKFSTTTVTPVSTDQNATIKVNGTTVASGSASGPVALAIGHNTITIVVTAQNGTTTKTYTVTVVRVPSANDNLASMNSSVAPLSPAFAPGTTAFTLSVSNAVSTMTVAPVTSDGTATIKVNGAALISGAVSPPLALAEGTTTNISVVVTAQDGITSKTYTITVTRAPSIDARLANMSLSSGTLSPTFASATIGYTSSVPNSTSTVKVTPTTTDAHASIKVNGTTVASGSASQSITLLPGTNTIYVVVTAQNGTTKKTYTITVTRVASANANLASINPSATPLSPAFAPATTSYTINVANSVNTMTVRPATSDVNATMKVNGMTLASGATSIPNALLVGSNTINIAVTAQNGTTIKTYTITVTRASGGADSYDPGISVTRPAETPTIAEDGLVVHQGISPNGDGVNDFLLIDGIQAYSDNKLTIMNRNGQLIYEARGYDNNSKSFDGHSSKTGKMQLPGTYFYQLDYIVNGITKHKTGFIVLKY